MDTYSNADINEIMNELAANNDIQPPIISETSDVTNTESTNDLSPIEVESSIEEPPAIPEEPTTDEIVESNINAYKSILDNRETVSRFKGANWFDIAQQQAITLVGIGGINSWSSFLLSRIRPTYMYLIDDDRVELGNLSGQLYGKDDVGKYKGQAMMDFIETNSDYYRVFAMAEKFTKESSVNDIMICGFDNMKARKLVYNKWKEHVLSKPEDSRKYCLLIDGRLSAEVLQVFCMTGEDVYYQDKYEKEWLFTDEEADATVCSYKQTSYCAAIIGGIITNLFVNFCTNLANPIVKRDLPFMTSYEGDTMYFKTES